MWELVVAVLCKSEKNIHAKAKHMARAIADAKTIELSRKYKWSLMCWNIKVQFSNKISPDADLAYIWWRQIMMTMLIQTWIEIQNERSYKRSLPSPWMAPPGHWTLHTLSTINMQTCRMVATMLLHCLYNQHACTWCLVGGWLLLCSTSSQKMFRKKHTAQWHRVWSNQPAPQKHSQQTQRQIYKIHQTLLCPHFCAQSGHI